MLFTRVVGVEEGEFGGEARPKRHGDARARAALRGEPLENEEDRGARHIAVIGQHAAGVAKRLVGKAERFGDGGQDAGAAGMHGP